MVGDILDLWNTAAGQDMFKVWALCTIIAKTSRFYLVPPCDYVDSSNSLKRFWIYGRIAKRKFISNEIYDWIEHMKCNY